MLRSALLLAVLGSSLVVMADDAAIKISAKDGKFTPDSVEVAAGKPFVLEVSNDGAKAIEFESKALRQEKVVAPGKSITVKINGVKAGKYKFYDEYNEAATGVVVAK